MIDYDDFMALTANHQAQVPSPLVQPRDLRPALVAFEKQLVAFKSPGSQELRKVVMLIGIAGHVIPNILSFRAACGGDADGSTSTNAPHFEQK